jgi:hypothetical protein
MVTKIGVATGVFDDNNNPGCAGVGGTNGDKKRAAFGSYLGKRRLYVVCMLLV